MNPAIAQSLPILSLVVVGFLLKLAGLIRPGDGQVMTRLIVNTTLPAIIFVVFNTVSNGFCLSRFCGPA